jgi:hypothetical protein
MTYLLMKIRCNVGILIDWKEFIAFFSKNIILILPLMVIFMVIIWPQ